MLERRVARIIVLLLILAVLGMAVQFYSNRSRAGMRSREAALAVAIAALEKRTPEVHFENTALADVFGFIQDASGLRLRVNWDALAREGVDPATPVSAQLRDIKIDKLLRTILDEAGGGTVRLSYDIAGDGHLFITTERELLSAVETRSYDIRDFLKQAPDDQTCLELIDAICNLIMDVVASDSWKATGGDFADLRYENGFLVVTQTSPMHDRVCRLFKQLRETRSNPLKILTAEYSTTWESR